MPDDSDADLSPAEGEAEDAANDVQVTAEELQHLRLRARRGQPPQTMGARFVPGAGAVFPPESAGGVSEPFAQGDLLFDVPSALLPPWPTTNPAVAFTEEDLEGQVPQALAPESATLEPATEQGMFS